jgi:predicted nucleic acid-binding protein
MKFWDTSAIVPLLLDEPTSPQMRLLSFVDRFLLVSFLTPVEITSALFRRARTSEIDTAALNSANRQLAELRHFWLAIEEINVVLPTAMELLTRHSLRAGDAIQLASAIAATADRSTVPFVTLDKRLAVAAAAEGFEVLPQPSA